MMEITEEMISTVAQNVLRFKTLVEYGDKEIEL
jgi:lysyl-tRNA synthetase class II